MHIFEKTQYFIISLSELLDFISVTLLYWFEIITKY